MRPIFIGGCPRSGTTLLGAMLGAHKECLTIPESHFKTEALRSLGTPRDAVAVRAALNRMLKHWTFRTWGMSLNLNEFPEREIGGSYGRLLEWIVTKYGEHVGKKDYSVWVDHTPRNIWYLHTLLRIFPEAKTIHIVRDGRAAASSILPLDWGPNTIIGAAHWWLEHVSYGIAAESAWGDDQIVRVIYEDLVTNPENVMKGLCSWLGIDYDPAMVNGGGFQPTLFTAKQEARIGKEPDPKRASAWESELTPWQIEAFESVTGEFLLYLGYELKYGLRARRISGIERIKSMAVDLFMEVVNEFRLSYRMRKTVGRSP